MRANQHVAAPACKLPHSCLAWPPAFEWNWGWQVEESLGELLLLCQRSEEYSQYLLGMLAHKAPHAAAAGASSKPHGTSSRENAFRSGPFCTAVRELVSCYTHLVSWPVALLILQLCIFSHLHALLPPQTDWRIMLCTQSK